MKTILLTLSLIFTFGNNLFAQKTIVARYSGGQACVDLDLKLYSDSTFIFVESQGSIIPSHSKRTGNYLRSDTSITFIELKRFHFLYFSKENKYRSSTYRIREDKILMFTKEAENSKDSGFIRAYNTLYLSKYK